MKKGNQKINIDEIYWYFKAVGILNDKEIETILSNEELLNEFNSLKTEDVPDLKISVILQDKVRKEDYKK